MRIRYAFSVSGTLKVTCAFCLFSVEEQGSWKRRFPQFPTGFRLLLLGLRTANCSEETGPEAGPVVAGTSSGCLLIVRTGNVFDMNESLSANSRLSFSLWINKHSGSFYSLPGKALLVFTIVYHGWGGTMAVALRPIPRRGLIHIRRGFFPSELHQMPILEL